MKSDRWLVTIRWQGPRSTPRDAALLRQFVPSFRDGSIPEVLRRIQGLSEWKEHRLSNADMQWLRREAEARGFQVEVAPEGFDKPLPRLPPPGSGMPHYSVQLEPAFHEPGHILVTLGPDGDSVSIVSTKSSETVPLSTEQGLWFLDEMAALDPLGIPDAREAGIDGITLRGHSQQDTGSRTFTAWSPDAHSFPRQRGFALALYRLATGVAREPATVAWLEQLFRYLEDGLPVKVFDGPPLRIRLFGSLSTRNTKELESLFASIPPEEPVLMDLSGLEVMGSLLYPLFARFHARPGRTVWWVNVPASIYLQASGVPPARLYRDREAALAALRDG